MHEKSDRDSLYVKCYSKPNPMKTAQL